MRTRTALAAAATALTLTAPLLTASPATARPTVSADTTTAPSASGAPAPRARTAPAAPWASGIPISRAGTPSTGLGWSCTAGLPARKGNRTFLITAGHCARAGETISTPWRSGKRTAIGTVTGYSTRYDIAAIETTEPARASYWAGTTLRPLRGVATATRGQSVCHNGARSGRVCGIRVAGSRSHKGTVVLVYGYRATGHTARPGDSGALVTDNRDRALGIISEISPDGRWIAWTPATTALNNWRLAPVVTR